MILIVGISYPLFQIYQENVGVKKGLQIVIQTMNLARTLTVTKKMVHYLHFDKDKQLMQIYMENTGNRTLEIDSGNIGGSPEGGQQNANVDLKVEGGTQHLPKQVGFFTDVAIFKVNPSYVGFLPESGLILPVGIQLTNKEKFMDDPKNNADLGLIYPLDSPYKCIYIKIGRLRGGVDEAVFDQCPGSGKTR